MEAQQEEQGEEQIKSILTLFPLFFVVFATGLQEELHLTTPAPIDPDLPASLERAADISCAACHLTITEEWATSLHAFAWVNPRYQKAIARTRRKASCTGCHIPAPLFKEAETGQARRPRSRAANREAWHFGISCKTCHMGPNGVILGPFGLETDAHATQRSEHFIGTGTDALCAACHSTTIGPVIGLAEDFEEFGGAAKGMSCVGCHMAPLERSIATDDDDLPMPVRKGRSHALQTPRDPSFLAQAFHLQVEGGTAGLFLAIENRAGHRVPGLEGRRFVFRIEDPDADRRKQELASLTFDTRAHLPAGGRRELRLPKSSFPERIRVLGEHFPPGAKKPVVFIDRTFRAPPR